MLIFNIKIIKIQVIFSSFLSLLINTLAYATNPVEGWYTGVYLSVSYAPNINLTIQKPPSAQVPTGTGTIEKSILGGVGGEIGYRCEPLRLEGQLLYNNNGYNSLTIGNITINGTSTSANTNHGPEVITTALTVNGQTNTLAFLVNFIYDLYTPSHDNVSPFVPYIGGGAGIAYVQNNLQFEYNDSPLIFGGVESNYTAGAGQGIVGFNYFLDDFTTLGVDFRYFTTMTHTHKTRSQFNTFSTHESLYTINVLFNGAFDFG